MEPQTHIGTSKSGAELWLSADERREHLAILGATGTGKSTLLRSLVAQAIASADGLLLVDPHGNLAEAALHYVRPSRRNEVCYLNVADLEFPVAFNILEDVHPDRRAVVVDGIVTGMRAIWQDSWGPRMERILRHTCRALMEVPGASLAMLPRFLTNETYRTFALRYVSEPYAYAYFTEPYSEFRKADRLEYIEPVLNKIETFLSFPAIRNILGQAHSTLHLEQAMRNARIVIMNLSKSMIGETAAHLMGSLFISGVLSKLTLSQKRMFHIIVDEAHNYGTAALPTLMGEARKFNTTVSIASQHLTGLEEQTRAAVLGTVHTLVCCRLGVEDAQLLAPNFNREHQTFNPYLLQHLERGEAVARIGAGDATAIDIVPPIEGKGDPETVIKQSRIHYAQRREVVEAKLRKVLGRL